MAEYKRQLRMTEAKINEEFAYLQSVFDLTKKISSANGNLFLTKAREVQARRATYEKLLEQQQYTMMEIDANYEPTFANLARYDELLDVILNVARTLQDRLDEEKAKLVTPTATTAPGSEAHEFAVKFPRLTLETFDGRVETWGTFHQLFEELIHKNNKITRLEKVTYLVTHLTGSAKSICAGIPATAENYELLYKTLVDRYQDVRSLGTHYLDKMVNFRALSSGSEKELLTFLEKFVEPALALKQLSIPNFFDFFMVYMAMKRLDGETCRQFELANRGTNLPTFDCLQEFVREQVKIISRQTSEKPKPFSGPKKTHAFVVQSDNRSENDPFPKDSCVVCSGKPHALYRCDEFKKLAVPARLKLVKKNRLCFNCLSKRHLAAECTSEMVCKICKKKHNGLLHFSDNFHSNRAINGRASADPKGGKHVPTEKVIPTASTPSSSEEQSITPVHSFLSGSVRATTVLLATARVAVQDRAGKLHVIRALLDSGSQSHFLTKQCCMRLGIPTKSSKAVVDCLGNKSTVSREQATLTFSSLIRPDIQFRVTACVLNEITNCLPSVPVALSNISHLQGLELADKGLHIPGPIDLLIGASLWTRIVCGTRVSGPTGGPVALESVLGWIVMGDVPAAVPTANSHSFFAASEPPLEILMERFWSTEEVPASRILDPDDAACEEHFVKTVCRKETGQYFVALPFRRSPDLLGDSYAGASKRFLSLERRLLRQPELHLQYADVMNGHIENGYISPVSPENLDGPAYYVPHHGVFKPSSSSTPLRVVWNMSAPTSSGYSLNDLLYVGPRLQRDISEILLNYRLFEFVLSADVRQMYLRIGVKSEDCKFQRIIWRASPDDSLKVYEIKCLAFGLAPAPYLAQRVVRDLADQERGRHPISHAVVYRDLYMDDVATSVASEKEACALQRDLVELFKAGNFTLAKWCSNSPSLLAQVPLDLRLFGDQSMDQESHTKILGLVWDPVSDTFRFKLHNFEVVHTKRAILSNIAKIFDPLGFLSPVVTAAKILMKLIWTLQIDWDETTPESVRTQWTKFVAELPAISSVAIPRHVGVFPDHRSELVGFADASQAAYGAVVYVRSWSPDLRTAKIQILWAKSKVAPSKTKSIPRLELCAAYLLSRLLRLTVDLFSSRHEFDRIMAFTDSMVTLQWISASPSRWQTYVANRVAKVQENVGSSCWRHVQGNANPADCLSRGLTGVSLVNHPMWFSGPTWLQESEENWPVTAVSDLQFDLAPGEQRVAKLNTNVRETWILAPLLSRMSSLHRLHRTTAWVLRSVRRTTVRCGGLAVTEIAEAERRWLTHVQKTHFSSIVEELEANRFHKRRKPDPLVRRLDLFLDDGLIRVGGRLTRSDIPYEQKHPILLPKDDPYVTLIVDQCHIDNLHTGPFLLMALLRMKYWILSSRNLVRNRVHRCNVCFKSRPQPNTPKMAPLPEFRLQQAKAFTNCGVDYAGPLTIAMSRHRGNRTTKAYICLFVCMTTKAIHLELASDLSTPCFLAAFHRFLARRGPVSVMFSDQGTNFIGARSAIREVYEFAKSHQYNNALEADLASKKIEWRLNPPAAPHHGGLWESNVKSVKTHLHKVIGNQILTFEEMSTTLTQIEALLNSRPLCPLSGDPRAPVALTPAHFLTFGPTLDSFPPSKDVSDVPSNRLSHFERVNQIVQHYWKRWSQEYLHELQQRYKWQDDSPSLAVGNVVLIKNENTAPLSWPLAVIEEVFPGHDGKVRSAKVRTSNGQFIRPAVKLCVLPTQ